MEITCDTDRFARDVIEGNEYSYVFQKLIVVDVGCDWGSFSLWVRKFAGTVYAIDIIQENIENLKANIVKNSIDNIVPYCCAIGGGTGMRYFNPDVKPGNGGSMIVPNSEHEIQMYTLADFMARENIPYIDILKIDIEGSEFELLEAPSFPKDRVYTIVGEAHGERGGERVNAILQKLGYRTYDNGSHFLGRKI